MGEIDWALVHLKKCIEKTHGIRRMEEGSREGEITIHGGIVHCPGGHRSWTVSLFKGELKLYCIGCKRVFRLKLQVYDSHSPIGGFENVSVGVK